MNKIVLSVLGQDRPGIIAATAQALCDMHCNIENVSQTILQGEFAGIFIVQAPEGSTCEQLQDQLSERLAPMGQKILAQPLAVSTNPPEPVPSEPFVVTTRGPDRKGLVAGIASEIARFGANVTNLQAVFTGGHRPDDNIMIYEIDVPLETDQTLFFEALREKARELELSVDIQHRKIFEAIHRI